MKRILAVILVVLAIGILVASLSRPPAFVTEIEGQSWTLVRLVVDGADVPLPEGAEITLLHMDGKRYVGDAGVNSYEVHLAFNRDGGVSFGDEGGGVTEMAGPPHLMAIEAVYLAAFWKIQTVEISGSTLVFKGPGVRLEYGWKRSAAQG